MNLKTYIVVDDEIMIRQGLQIKISQTPTLEVTCVGEASNGIEALELMKSRKPDFVITDMKMSSMDGCALLERLDAEYPETPIIVISGYKLFDYVKQAIEKHAVGYVLKPFSAEEIAEQVKKAVELIDSRHQVSQLQKKVNDLEREKDQEVLLNAVTQTLDEESSELLMKKGYSMLDEYVLFTAITDILDFEPRLNEICGRSIPKRNYDILRKNGTHQFFVLLHTSSDRLNALFDISEKLTLQIMEASGDYHLYLFKSRISRSFQNLHNLFIENSDLLRNVYPSDRNKVLHSGEKADFKSIFSDEEIHGFIRDMKYYPAKINDCLSTFFNRFNMQIHTFGAISDACSELLEKVNEYAVKNEIEVKNPMEHFYDKYIFSGNIDQLQSDFSEYFHYVFSSIHLKEIGQENLLAQMTEYINKNYSKKLTLQQIASQFYISQSTCSNLLKENVGMTFNDYISKIRIQNAKKLLTETKLSVNKISDEIGYSNPKYFFKIFKKITGYTPLKYRSESFKKTRE